MKILFVIDTLYTSNNGTSISAQRYATELRKRGHEVRALCGDAPKSESDKQITDGDFCTGIFHFPIFQPLCEKNDFFYGNANKANNTIVIADGTDNVTIAEDVPNIGSVTMDRTFTVGKASTVMLPFDIAVSKVSGGTFYSFIGVDKSGSEWDVVMQEVNRVSGTLQAHTPYLFMPTAEHITFNLGGTTVTLKANSQQTYTIQPY